MSTDSNSENTTTAAKASSWLSSVKWLAPVAATSAATYLAQSFCPGYTRWVGPAAFTAAALTSTFHGYAALGDVVKSQYYAEGSLADQRGMPEEDRKNHLRDKLSSAGGHVKSAITTAVGTAVTGSMLALRANPTPSVLGGVSAACLSNACIGAIVRRFD